MKEGPLEEPGHKKRPGGAVPEAKRNLATKGNHRHEKGSRPRRGTHVPLRPKIEMAPPSAV
jgi:hypothetical protein